MPYYLEVTSFPYQTRIEDKDVDQSVDEGGVSLIGNKDMKLDRNVLSGNLHIKEGRMITPEDKDMCVISEELAKQNNLKIGDKISFNDYCWDLSSGSKDVPTYAGRYLPFGKCDIY